jgi:antagonist of KipI
MASSLLVREPGLLTSVQDLGRPGVGPLGVSPGGAADPVSLRLGNWLVGNPAGAAGLEMTLTGGTFEFPDTTVVALAGADFNASVEGATIEPWRPIQLRAGQSLRVGRSRAAARCYLCVRGGIEVPLVMGSASTDLPSKLGGFEGRALRVGDVLGIGEASGGTVRGKKLDPEALDRLFERNVLRVTRGPQAGWFSGESMRALSETAFRVGEQSDRQGLRLEGARLAQGSKSRMISEGVSLGAIQVTPDGTPIILFVDQQTTGGYVKLANVISADLHRVGQLRPRDEIRFEPVSIARAVDRYKEQEHFLGELMPE